MLHFRITRIAVRVGVTVNAGNYESYRLELEEEAEISEGADVNQALTEIATAVRAAVHNELIVTEIPSNLAYARRIMPEAYKSAPDIQ